jgi:hypothetical protein
VRAAAGRLQQDDFDDRHLKVKMVAHWQYNKPLAMALETVLPPLIALWPWLLEATCMPCTAV